MATAEIQVEIVKVNARLDTMIKIVRELLIVVKTL